MLICANRQSGSDSAFDCMVTLSKLTNQFDSLEHRKNKVSEKFVRG